MPTVSIDGVSLYYEEKGEGEPVIFSHGIPTDYRA
jgi:pimeloyl-ACP methyl ester carboxylesterase